MCAPSRTPDQHQRSRATCRAPYACWTPKLRVRHNSLRRRTSGRESGVRRLGRLALDVTCSPGAQAFIFAVIGEARGASQGRPKGGERLNLALSNVVKRDGWQRAGKVWQAARTQEGVRRSSTYVG